MTRGWLSLAAALSIGAGCSDSLITTETLAGTYEATVFTVQEGTAASEDILTKGGFISITLNVEGTTTGQVFVPDAGEGGTDFDADLTGTWTLDGGTVTLEHTADTFLRDMTFTVDGDKLLGHETFGDAVVDVQLTRQ